MKKWQLFSVTAILGGTILLAACNEDESASQNISDTQNGQAEQTEKVEQSNNENAQLSGEVMGDGSSTVAPITEAIVELYAGEQPKVEVAVGVSGTGGGFEKLINGETDFSNASRKIKDEEAQKLTDAGIDYTEFKIANDGLTVVVNKENDWATDLTVEQLQQIWTEDGTTKKWSDIDPSWPSEEIVFYAPGTDSGTYDYFDEVILDGEDLVANTTLSEDDNLLVQGVAGDKYAIAFFGYAYYYENESKLTAVAVNGIEPNAETIGSNEYAPLSRPLFVYVKNSAIKENEAFYNFMEFTLQHAAQVASETGYVALNETEYTASLEALQKLK